MSEALGKLLTETTAQLLDPTGQASIRTLNDPLVWDPVHIGVRPTFGAAICMSGFEENFFSDP